MKRFYREAAAAPAEAGWRILLDGREVKTPARNPLVVPGESLGAAIADEWNAQGNKVDPRSMPLTGLANAAIDRVAPGKDAFARGLAAYAETDLLCYRAEGPAALARRQAELWNPILDWARRRFDAEFALVGGIMHRPQPEPTVRRLAEAVAARDPFALAGLAPLVTIGGSLVAALALAEGAIGVEEAWAAVTLDEAWQAEHWGEDSEGARVQAARRAEFEAAARFLALL